MTRASVIVALLVVGGCQWLLDHSLHPLPEDSDALCRDGRDNDFNGLSDCQDWGCLDELVCCTLQDVVFVDAFEGPSCSDPVCQTEHCASLQCGPDTELWHTWPCPYPIMCGGALRPRKSFPACYAAGVLSQRSAPIGPGLALTIELDGVPERQGYLEAAFTVREPSALPGANDQCSSVQSIGGFVALRYVWSPEGSRLIASTRGVEIGRSEPLASGRSHLAEILVSAQRRVEFRVDGILFATSEPLPETSEHARVALTGASESAAFLFVQLRAGARCHDPDAWTLTGADLASSEALPIAPLSTAWDADEVHTPAVRERAGVLELFYTGCRYLDTSRDGCAELGYGVGRAIAAGDGVFQRSASPLLGYFEIPRASLDDEITVEVTPGAEGFVTARSHSLRLIVEDNIAVVDESVLTTGFLGTQLGALAAVQHPDGRTFLWFSRKERDNEPWRIGLAISSDGRMFTEQGVVLEPGDPADFDSEGVRNPEVIFDPDRGVFLMWYQGRDFYGNIAVGHAASVDGIRWSKAPHNPVIDRTFGFGSLGRPTVISGRDGRSRLFIDGTPPGDSRRRIYALDNDGTDRLQSP